MLLPLLIYGSRQPAGFPFLVERERRRRRRWRERERERKMEGERAHTNTLVKCPCIELGVLGRPHWKASWLTGFLPCGDGMSVHPIGT